MLALMKKLLAVIIIALVIGVTPVALASDIDAPAGDSTNNPSTSNSKKVVLIVANNISVKALGDAQMPALKQSLTENAAIGLMNVRSAKGASDAASAYLSIGAGARARSGAFARLAIDRGEPLMFDNLRQGFRLPGRAQVGTPSYPDISRQNAKLSYPVSAGALGEALRQAGIKRSVHGNTDNQGTQHREVNLITMDARGLTDFGSVKTPIKDPEQALTVIDDELKRSRFIAIEYGPPGTIDGRRHFISDKQIEQARRAALADLDQIFGELLKRADADRMMIVIVSPETALGTPYANRFRTPVVIAAPGYRGILRSGSTRWNGLLVNTDIAPTILNWLDVPVPDLLPGRIAFSVKHSDPFSLIQNMEDKVLANYSARSILLSPYRSLSIALMLMAVAALLFARGNSRAAFIQPFLLTFMFMPVVALLVNNPSFQLTGLPLVVIPFASLVFGWGSWLLWRHNATIAATVPAIVTVPVILAQLPFSSVLERDSMLGMSSVIGARFYGIGNEYVGVLLGAAVIAISRSISNLSVEKRTKALIAATLFLLLTAIIGLPVLGANVGGALAGVATGGIFFLTLRDIRIGARHLAYILVGMGLAIAGILTADYLTDSFSHVLRAASLAGNGNAAQIGVIASRKLGNNIRLITRTSWTNILVTAIIVAVMLRFGARELWDRILKNNRTLTAGWQTLSLASVAALIFNDSGVVTAAFMVLFAVLSWLYLMVDAAVSAPQEAETAVGQRARELLSR